MRRSWWLLVALPGCFLLRSIPYGQAVTVGIDPEALIERILSVHQRQSAELSDVILEAEYVEGKHEGEEGFVEKVRFDKRVYLRYADDTAWFYEEYLAYYRDGRLQKQEDLEKEAAKRQERKRERGTRDISYSMLKPFYPAHREEYEIVYQGVADETVEGQVCHHFSVVSKVQDDGHVNGEYYFEAASFHPVRVDFSPARLVKRAMFRLKELSMSVVYGASPEGFWLPKRFDVDGRGKRAFFFGFRFAGTEYYRNAIINSGLSEEMFEVSDDE